MLKGIAFRNYRCFESHRITLRPLTVAVGRNNAGKTTVVEGLRLLSLATARLTSSNYRSPPPGVDIPYQLRGVQLRLDPASFNYETLFHHYGSPPALVTGEFASGASIEVHLVSSDYVFAACRLPGSSFARSRREARLHIDLIEVLPQVGPLRLREAVLNPDYVRANMSGRLAPRHFRNQLRYERERFRDFVEHAERSWPGLRFRSDRVELGESLSLFVQDGDFVSEIGWMGHGLQIWLQVVWFLARIQPDSVIVLDEPDVYLHPDLQRRLMRQISEMSHQVIVTTHSVEMMSEATPADLLIVDKLHRVSRFANSQRSAQLLIDQLGSSHSLSFARLWDAKKLIALEGKDIELLEPLYRTLALEGSLVDQPQISIGGWTGWPYTIGSRLLLKNSAGDAIRVYCLLDRDYHTDAEVDARLKEARTRAVELHVWGRKELENYLLVPSAISRLMKKRARRAGAEITAEAVREKIEAIAHSMRDEVTDRFVSSFHEQDRRAGPARASSRARAHVSERWGSMSLQLTIVPGKEVISQLARWAADDFKASFSAIALAREIRADEVDEEVVTVLVAMSAGSAFDVHPSGTPEES